MFSFINNKFSVNDPFESAYPSVTPAPSNIIKHFHTPITTSTSVLGLAFDGGVIIAADILGSYGSLARFKNCRRILKINRNIVLGVSGDYADFQYLQEVIKGKIISEECLDDNILLKPAALHCWLTRVLYNRRSKVDPLWTTVIVGGMENGTPFLGAVDKLGTAFADKHIATGYGAYIAVPLLRDALEKNPKMNKAQAIEAISKCLEILYYRDARSLNKYEIAIVTADGSEIIGPLDIKADWSTAYEIKGKE